MNTDQGSQYTSYIHTDTLKEEYIQELEPSSIEYRTEKDDLHKLMEYHKHLKVKINVND